MKDWIKREWRLTPIYWQMLLLALTLLLVLRFGAVALDAAGSGDFDRLIRSSVTGIGMVLGNVWWPFGIAAAARRRSRSFGTWLLCGLVFSPIIVGLVYLAVRSDSVSLSQDSAGAAVERAERLRTRGMEVLIETANPVRAIRLLRRAAEMGDARAQFLIGSFYEAGSGVGQNYVTAAKWFHKAAMQNNPEAQAGLGNLYVMGQGVPQDFGIAARWIRLAAEQENADAQHTLGFMYFTGRGLPQDFDEAARWYRRAAEQGNANARNDLNALDAMERGIREDSKQAAALFSAAVAQGNLQAKAELLGEQSFAAKVQEKAREEADISDYLKAANDGDPDAQSILAGFYESGTFVPMDCAEAARWYRKSAEHGNSYAQHNLALLYKSGRGVAQSNAEAFFWLYIASSGKLGAMQEDYPDVRDAMGLAVPPAERAEVIREAQRWLVRARGRSESIHCESSVVI